MAPARPIRLRHHRGLRTEWYARQLFLVECNPLLTRTFKRNANIYTHNWASHIAIFGTSTLFYTLYVRKLKRLHWPRTLHIWGTLGFMTTGVSYSVTEQAHMQKYIDSRQDLKQIRALACTTKTEWAFPLSWNHRYFDPIAAGPTAVADLYTTSNGTRSGTSYSSFFANHPFSSPSFDAD